MSLPVKFLPSSRFLGAGISTDAGIPDFRGPNGIWTLEGKSRQKRKRKEYETELSDISNDNVAAAAQFGVENAKPTVAHEILVKLSVLGKLKFLVTQNVDNLHLLAGFPRKQLAHIHGNLFNEICSNQDCKNEIFHETDVGGMNRQPTGTKCEKCDSQMTDSVCDWNTPLPEKEVEMSQQQCKQADLILVLGSSLRMFPCGEWPLLGEKFVIVNLQRTPLDSEAELVIRERINKVMTMLAKLLDL